MATPEPKWPRRASFTRSPDTASPIWPDRPIRPLPRNRLRSQLSPEQADSIVYPLQPPPSSPLFGAAHGLAEGYEAGPARMGPGQRHAASPTQCDCGGYHPDHSEEEEPAFDHPTYRWSSPVAEGQRAGARSAQQRQAGGRAGKAPPAPASVASSADGYESFENTSNKKKRKIPVSSGSSNHQSSLSAEMANMGISSPPPEDRVNGDGGSGAAAVGGAGRGRFGRHGNVKNERRGGPNGAVMNGYSSSLSARSRGGDYRGDGTKPDGDEDIISTAATNALDPPATPPAGKENVSLLSQQADKSTTPKSQFTFTCETDTSSKLVWPLQGTGSYNTSRKKEYYPVRQQSAGMAGADQATQTAHMPRGSAPPPRHAVPPPIPGQAHCPPAPVNGQLPPPKPRRRRPSKEFALAARQRRLQQEFNNFSQRPHKDQMWICEFCEYEDIWGRPPEALIRQYEIKDRAERKKAEERRRLLEKAKMKKNKGKKGKGGKNAGNAQAAGGAAGQGYDRDGLSMPPDLPGDEYYDDEFDDAYDADGHPHDNVHGEYGHQHHYDARQQLDPPLPPPPAPARQAANAHG